VNWLSGDRGEEAVAPSMHGLDKARRSHVIVEGAANLTDAEGEGVLAHGSPGPERRQQCGSGHELPGMLHEVAQDGKHFGREWNDARAALQLLVLEIQPIAIKAKFVLHAHFFLLRVSEKSRRNLGVSSGLRRSACATLS
jgi:hypothetical protein